MPLYFFLKIVYNDFMGLCVRNGVNMKYIYKNRELHHKINIHTGAAIIVIVLYCLSLLPIILSLSGAYREIYHAGTIDLDSIEGCAGERYSFILDKMPEELDSVYYMVRYGNHTIVMKNMDQVINVINEKGHARLVGVLHRFDDGDPVIAAAEEYYRTHNCYEGRKLEKMARTYVDCQYVGFWDVLIHDYVGGLAIGIPWLLFTLWLSWGEKVILTAFRDRFPVFVGNGVTPEEVDRQADMPETKLLSVSGILAAPDMLIGTNKGLTAVSYGDIVRVSVRHKKRFGNTNWTNNENYDKLGFFDWCVVTVQTKDNRELIFYEHRNVLERDKLAQIIDEKCGLGIWKDENLL